MQQGRSNPNPPDFDHPRVAQFHVGPDRAGQRLDNCLMALLKGVPKSAVYRLLRTGQVRVNGGRAKPHRKLEEGDVVRIPPVRVAERSSTRPPDAAARDLAERVLHEDRHFLVIDKPAGVASHGGSGIAHGAIELLRAARPGDTLELVHRLDRDTSGVLVLSRSRKALVGLQALIRDGAPVKQYLALLDGAVEQSKFQVNAPLRKFALQGGERMVRVSRDGKPALTWFRELQRLADASYVEVTLETGRTHQIRVHAAHAGHPLAGDGKYAPRDSVQRFRKLGLERLFLHAARFEFEWGERAYSFSAPLPDELRAVLDKPALAAKA